MDKNCIFCKIINREIPGSILYEDEDFIVIFDKFPSKAGHTLVITKKHIESIYDMDSELASKLFVLVAKVAKELKSVLKCEGLNILQNNGSVAGQEVNHFHMHVIPRYENDTVKIKWESKEANDEELKELNKRIKIK